MSNPQPKPVKVVTTPRDADDNPDMDKRLSFDRLLTPTVPVVPKYTFLSAGPPKLTVASATFNYDTQHPDVKKYVNDQATFGHVEYPVKKLYNQLITDHIITVVNDQTKLAANPPNVTVVWTDKDGNHTQTFGMEDTIVIGKLDIWGEFMKKPGQLSWDAAEVAGRLQFWVAMAGFWVLMIVWAYKMWGHLGDNNLTWTTATNNERRFGDYGVWFAKAAGVIAPFGATRYVMAFLAALAPIWSFCIQFAMWYFVDSQVTEPLHS